MNGKLFIFDLPEYFINSNFKEILKKYHLEEYYE